ncbi:calcium-transporting ATPase 7, plasma membrane-type [Oryza brachyantha]|uniref:Calcium-transporting ATPase n=1 Tax=Oryza brachyantha TaxID=4533 RepID=J3N2P8_ORYBR|nr:calcium-transporting ATPase 7, plasma membrane-type [Oryza brachyantha]
MECADYLIGSGRRCPSSSSPPSTSREAAWCPEKQWRKAANVITTCHRLVRLRLARLGFLSAAIVRRANSYVEIHVDDDDDALGVSCGGDGEAVVAFTVAADDESFKGLVKDRREGRLRSLGGGGGVAAALASGAERGIRGDGADVARRKAAFGENTYPKPKPKNFFRHVWDALADVFLIVLLVCAVVSLAFGIKEHGLKDGWYDGVSIFLAVFLVAAVSAVSNHSQAKRFDKLARESENITVSVVRAGRRQEVSIFDVVVGDVVVLKIGDVVPADGVFLEGHALQVDESSMTGEPHPVEIDARRSPFLASGVKVVDGYGKMVVTAVGTDTAWGEMMTSITRENTDPTPLQERLERLTSSIGKIGVAVALLVFTVLTARHFTGSTKDDQGSPLFDKRNVTFNAVFSGLVGIFQQAVTIIVVAIPEGLPLAVTLTLAFSMKRMVKENALVRRLSACETMGSVTAICTDKTGTLTLNQMKVTEFWVGPDRAHSVAAVAGGVVSSLCQGAGLNTTGSVYRPDNVSLPEITGSPTEKALLSWAVEELGMDAGALKRKCKVVHVEAFNSDKKRSGVMVKDAATGEVTAHWKGAAEMVLASCSTYVGADGVARELGVEQRRKLEQVINDMAAASLRCIAFAYKQVVDGDGHSTIDDEGLTLLGFVGLKDPCRPEVRSAIEACTKAGIAVKMVTGDNLLTARAIAKECGIISDEDTTGVVIEGHVFRAMSPDEQLGIVDKIRVMARSLPLDKLVLVQRLKQKGHVVAVTGDGTNDAPALKEADVGLSMGVQGTEVAKESSDIVILNDNFDTVVTATRWGRCVYNNIQKFIQFQLTVNVAALVINFVSAVTTGKMPLTTVQLLWVNLIMDTMGALALATDTPTDGLMRRPPIGRTAPLISNAMWRNLAAQAAFQVAVLLALQHRGRDVFGAGERANGTMIFNAFVLCQVFNEFNAREIERRNVFAGVVRNRMFLGIVAVTVALQVVMVEVLTRFAGTERLGWVQWGACVGIAAMSWPIGWAVKCIPVPERPFHEIIAARWRSSVRHNKHQRSVVHVSH